MEGLSRIAPCYTRRLIGDIVAVEKYPLPQGFVEKNSLRIGRTDEVTPERARRQLESGWRPSINTDVRCFWALGKAFHVKRCFTLGVQRSMDTTLTIHRGRIHVFTRDQQHLPDGYLDGELREGYFPGKLRGFLKTELEEGDTFNVPPLHCYVIVAQTNALFDVDPAVALLHVPARPNLVQPAVRPEQPPVRVVQPPIHVQRPRPHVERPRPYPDQPRPHVERPCPYPEQPRPHVERPCHYPEQPRPHPEQPRPNPEQPRPNPEQPHPNPEQPRPEQNRQSASNTLNLTINLPYIQSHNTHWRVTRISNLRVIFSRK